MGVGGSWEQKIDFLKSIDATYTKMHDYDCGVLLEHLIGVHDILKELNVSEHIQDAGLFHSVYGTPYFKEKMTIDRDVVCKLIGDDAEELVYIFCNLQHPRLENIIAIEDATIKKSLLLIHQANVDEVNRRKESKSRFLMSVHEINEDKLIQYLKNEIWFRAKPSGVDGVGLFAIRDIPEGTNILVETSQFDDGELGRHISFKIKKENMLDLHPNIKNLWKDYCHNDNIWQYITISPNYKRMQLFFMNHSDNPNSYVNFVGDVREHITNKEIKENEEIFHNYKTNHRWAAKLRNFY